MMDVDDDVDVLMMMLMLMIMDVDNNLEYGAYAKHSFDRGDITLSYYKGNDRVFNLSGINIWANEDEDVTNAAIDTVLSYRNTEVIGIGGSFVTDIATIRMDYGYFYTKDLNNIESIPRDRDDMQYNTDPLTQAFWHHLLRQVQLIVH